MSSVVVSDDAIDACGFRMFSIPEIARTMAMEMHPGGGLYKVSGNKREKMRKYGNAVTPPVHHTLMPRIAEIMGGPGTFSDVFCGAGGTTNGAMSAGWEPVLGLNHWRSAIDDYAENFPGADVDCADVSAMTTNRIRSYPDSDVFVASPECTNHSQAKGGKRRKPQAASLFEDGPAGDDEQDRSRATMWDVVRFAEQKLIKGKPYKAIIVENVTDAFKWGADDNGSLFAAWRMAVEALGYRSKIVWLNSMFCPPTPQSRDRMYVVFWLKTMRSPNLRIEPISWCPTCEAVVNGQQVWKRPSSPLHQKNGSPTAAKYGDQYLYGCPTCRNIVIPGACPAASALDFTIPAPLIGDRKTDLKPNTRERIRRGLERLGGEPFAIRLLHGVNPRPMTLPLVTLTARHDMAMVIPTAGNTYETTPGNRARDAASDPLDTVHTTLDRAVVLANRANNVPKIADREPSAPVMTGGTIGLVELQRHGQVRDAEQDPAGTLRASGFHHAIVVRNNGNGGSSTGWESTPTFEPIRTLTGACHQSLVVPYGSEASSAAHPAKTLTTIERLALIVPATTEGMPRDARREPSFTQTTETRPFLLEATP